MRRAVITGLGIVSCLGNDKDTVTQSLRNGVSGLQFRQDFADMGLRCNVGPYLDIDVREHIDRKILRFMGESGAYAYISAKSATFLALRFAVSLLYFVVVSSLCDCLLYFTFLLCPLL